MNFEKAKKPSEIPFGVYSIDKDYINAMREQNRNIFDPEYQNKYIGPVFNAVSERDPVDYFVPINDSFDTDDDHLAREFRQDGIRYIFDFERMITCADKGFLTENSENAILAENIEKHRKSIEEHAECILNGRGFAKPRITASGFEKNDAGSDIPFGVYTVDREFINALRLADDKVLDPDITVRYAGPVYNAVCKRGPFDFFVPVDPSWHGDEFYLCGFCNGVFAFYFDFKKMIPCVNKSFLTPDDSDPALTKFCGFSEEDMRDCAEYMVSLQKNRKGE